MAAVVVVTEAEAAAMTHTQHTHSTHTQHTHVYHTHRETPLPLYSTGTRT